jgi:hypothetical protein
MAYHLDGRASVLFGTHTHVPTADERVFPKGLGYITDLGMTGPIESVIGAKYEQSVSYFRGELPLRFDPAPGDCKLQGALFEVDEIGAAKDCLSGIRSNPLNTWRNSTEYLLGRIAEREKRYGDAQRHYGNTASSMSGAGNALRAKWLPSPQ